MPLAQFIQSQLHQLDAFLGSPDQCLRVVQHDPETRSMLTQLLSKRQDDETWPHVLAFSRAPFVSEEPFFAQLTAELAQANEPLRQELGQQGVKLPRPGEGPARERFARYVSDVAGCLPDHAGAYAVVLDPPSVGSEAAFREAVMEAVKVIDAPWAKVLVLDSRTAPAFEGVEQQDARASVQVFFLSPERMEQQLQRRVDRGAGDPRQRRRDLAMLGGFALSRQDHQQAIEHQAEVARLAAEDGAHAEEAVARYNMGYTHLQQQQYAEARQCLARAAELGVARQHHSLAALALVELGLALQGQKELELAVESFDAASRTFEAVGQPPGQVHALDCLGSALAQEGYDEEAEQAFRQALAINDGITGEHVQDLRLAGRRPVVEHLQQFYQQRGQAGKARALDGAGA